MDFTIPTQTEPTQDSFPGSPRKVKKWLADLQTSDIGETTRQFYNGLKHSNRLVNDARARVEIMELFRPTARLVFKNLLKRYSMLGLPLPEKARRIFDLNLAILKEMAFGYKIALVDAQIGNSSLPAKTQGLAAHRSISYLTEILLRCTQIYSSVPASIWKDLHQLYLVAESIDFHTKVVLDNELEVAGKSTVQQAYIRALLLSLSRPESLRKGEVVHVYNALEKWSEQATIAPLQGKPENSNLFGINLNTDAPPTPLRFLHANQGAVVRTLDLSDLMATVTREIESLPDMESPIVKNRSLPRNALLCLKANWGMQTERKSARATRNERVTVEVGLKDIHAHMVYIQTPPKPERKADSSPIYHDSSLSDLQLMALPEEDRNEKLSSGFITHPDMNQSEEPNVWDSVVNRSSLTEASVQAQKDQRDSVGQLKAEDSRGRQNWVVTNISSGGFGIRWEGESTSRAHVGELIALQEATTDNLSMQWRIGVLRWMQFSSESSFVAGVQTISPRIVPVMVERKRSASKVDITSQECLMLPEIKPIGQASSLISPAHMFRLGEIVTLRVGGRELKYKLIDLEEQTGSFSQFIIQPASVGASRKVEPVMPNKMTTDNKVDADDEFDGLWDTL
ncbi:MAG: hypothetical protein AAF434_13370 [Pseudomonadota bacterium]